ncbi:MAG: hypothetical protein ACK5W9_13290 [Bdellovibrionales bacterium]
MYSRFILAIQIVFIFSQASSREIHLMEGGRSESAQVLSSQFRVVDDLELQNYVYQTVDQLEKIAKSKIPATQKLSEIKFRVNQVSDFRTKNWSKSAFVEQQLDLNIKPYESFPDPQIFKRERCSQYRARISVDWEPLSSDYRSVQTGVARALRILKEICSS